MKNKDEYIRSVGRALQILKTFEDKQQKTLTDISKECDLPMPTALRILSTLTEEGFLVKKDNNVYELGIIFLRLGYIVEKNNDLISSAQSKMIELSKLTNETICLNSIVDNKRVCISKVEGNETLRQFIEVGKGEIIHRGASGKLLLAFLPEDKREEILSEIKEEEKEYIYNLKKELVKIRREGVATSKNERILGLASISAPILGLNGKLLAGITISSASIRIDEATEKRYKQLVKEAAKDISKLLGYDIK
jgi:DNA-binding IclR family transcriptional regulator